MNPDTRPLPAGWSQVYDDQRKIWLYVQRDVVPPRISMTHPLGPNPNIQVSQAPSLSSTLERPATSPTTADLDIPNPNYSSPVDIKFSVQPGVSKPGLSFAQQLYASSATNAVPSPLPSIDSSAEQSKSTTPGPDSYSGQKVSPTTSVSPPPPDQSGSLKTTPPPFPSQQTISSAPVRRRVSVIKSANAFGPIPNDVPGSATNSSAPTSFYRNTVVLQPQTIQESPLPSSPESARIGSPPTSPAVVSPVPIHQPLSDTTLHRASSYQTTQSAPAAGQSHHRSATFSGSLPPLTGPLVGSAPHPQSSNSPSRGVQYSSPHSPPTAYHTPPAPHAHSPQQSNGTYATPTSPHLSLHSSPSPTSYHPAALPVHSPQQSHGPYANPISPQLTSHPPSSLATYHNVSALPPHSPQQLSESYAADNASYQSRPWAHPSAPTMYPSLPSSAPPTLYPAPARIYTSALPTSDLAARASKGLSTLVSQGKALGQTISKFEKANPIIANAGKIIGKVVLKRVAGDVAQAVDQDVTNAIGGMIGPNDLVNNGFNGGGNFANNLYNGGGAIDNITNGMANLNTGNTNFGVNAGGNLQADLMAALQNQITNTGSQSLYDPSQPNYMQTLLNAQTGVNGPDYQSMLNADLQSSNNGSQSALAQLQTNSTSSQPNLTQLILQAYLKEQQLQQQLQQQQQQQQQQQAQQQQPQPQPQQQQQQQQQAQLQQQQQQYQNVAQSQPNGDGSAAAATNQDALALAQIYQSMANTQALAQIEMQGAANIAAAAGATVYQPAFVPNMDSQQMLMQIQMQGAANIASAAAGF